MFRNRNHKRSADSGFTLIELLITIAVIGIVASIAIPNLLNALDRGRQKRTLADMRTIGSAVEAYALDNTIYPIQSTQGPISGAVSSALQPTYVKITPTRDGWSEDIRYGTSATGDGYTIRSYGKNGISDASSGQTSDFDCDIVFQAGRFTAWPQGVQT